MNIKNRQQVLAVVAIIAVVLLAGDKFVLSPLMASWKSRGDEVAKLRKDVAKGRALLAREQSIRDRWGVMKTNTLPVNASEAERELLRAFERWSRDSRVSVTSIKPQWKRNADDYVTLECRADAYGNMQAVTRFLYNLEQDPLALKVEAVEITTRDNNGRELALGVQVSGLVLSAQEQP